jgi:hypothetical protein
MVTHGLQHCNSAEMSVFSSFNVDFYDGTRVYYQIADATGNSSWNTCADMGYVAYTNYVNAYNGSIQGYFVFPHGLAMRYQRTGDTGARQSLSALEANGLFTYWPDTAYIINWADSREISYAIETNLQDQALGGTPNPHFQDLVEAQIGHFDQWFQSKSAAMAQPFMVALAAEALIQYWDVTQDPRIPPLLQLAADQIWSTSFETSCNCFRYYNDSPVDGTWTASSWDLSLLIAPLYGWVYQRTGAQVYRDQGDQIFNAGVAGAWLDGGKQFSQNYRWSGKYVAWRTLAAQPSGQPALSIALTSPTTGATYKASSSPLTISGTVSGQNVSQVAWISDQGGTGTAAGTSSWIASGIALQTGFNSITVTAYDAAGNKATATLGVTLDWSPQPQLTAVSVSPSSGVGPAQTFSFVFTDSQSSSNLAAAAVLFAAADGQNACLVVYDRNRGAIQLEWDNLLGGDSRPLSSPTPLENSQCVVGTAWVTIDAFSTTINLDITFKSPFTGLKNISMYGADGDGSSNTGWAQMGTWTPNQ